MPKFRLVFFVSSRIKVNYMQTLFVRPFSQTKTQNNDCVFLKPSILFVQSRTQEMSNVKSNACNGASCRGQSLSRLELSRHDAALSVDHRDHAWIME